MLLELKCLETAIAVAFGCCGLAKQDGIDLGTVAGGMIAGTSLVGAWNDARAKSGLDSEKLLDRSRKAIYRDVSEWAAVNGADLEALADADLMMRNNLADCTPDIQTLGALVYDQERYPRSAALLVLNRLATVTDSRLFLDEGLPRAFAMQVVESALLAAMADGAYAAALRTHMLTALGQALHQLAEKVDAGFEAVKREIRAQGAELLDQVPDLALRREVMLLVGSDPQAGITEIAGDIARFARKYRQLLDELGNFRSSDNALQGAVQAAQQALRNGDLRLARHLYDEAVTAARDRAETPIRDYAGILAQQAEAAMLDRDWQAADAAWTQACGLLATIDQDAADSLDWDAANALQIFGERMGQRFVMEASIDRWTRLSEGESRYSHSASDNLAGALRILGERTGGPEGLAFLARAVAAHENALALFTKQDVPERWARITNNLANVLQIQGDRTGGSEGMAFLDRAILAYEDILSVYTRQDLPKDWAMATNNLGNALLTQGERIGGPESLPLLARAVAAFEDALTVRTSHDMPEQWAATSNNLANALQAQSKQAVGEEGDLLLTRAITVYEGALSVYDRLDLPVNRAMATNNLANALGRWGRRTGGSEGVAIFSRAVAARQDALTVYTRQDMPVQWALTKENLSLTLEAMADLETPAIHLQAAEQALLDALTVYTPDHMPYDHGTATTALARIREKLAALPD